MRRCVLWGGSATAKFPQPMYTIGEKSKEKFELAYLKVFAAFIDAALVTQVYRVNWVVIHAAINFF